MTSVFAHTLHLVTVLPTSHKVAAMSQPNNSNKNDSHKDKIWVSSSVNSNTKFYCYKIKTLPAEGLSGKPSPRSKCLLCVQSSEVTDCGSFHEISRPSEKYRITPDLFYKCTTIIEPLLLELETNTVIV